MKITTKEIAALCGVSIGTVDRALHNRGGIHPQTKEKILSLAKEHGYRPHLLARGLKRGRTMTIGVVVFDLDNQFFAQLVTIIEDRARQFGYFVYLTITEGNPAEEMEYLENLAGLSVDGIILFPINGGTTFSHYLKNLKTPIVTIGNKVSKNIPFIGVKDRQAITDAVAYIVAKGYQRIIYVSPPLSYKGQENIYSVEERLAGYKAGLKAMLPLQKPIIIRDKTYLQQLDALSFAVERTAILCSSDIYALEILTHFQAKGIRIPTDVGLMGFDNIQVLKYVHPVLTTIAYPIQAMGVNVVDCLLAQINAEPFAEVELLDHKIIPGASL